MDVLAQSPFTLNLGPKPAFAAGTTTTINIGTTFNYAINGVMYQKTAANGIATPVLDWATGLAFIPIPIPLSAPNLPSIPNGAAGYGGVYLFGVDSGQTLRCIQGGISALDANGSFITAPIPPAGLGPVGAGSTDNDFCVFGALLVKLGATAVATWTPGTNNMSAVTGATYTFKDLASIPGRPFVS